MAIGDLNKKFGWLWLIITPLMGMYMSLQFKTAAETGYATFDFSKGLLVGESFAKLLNKVFHVHSGLLAFLNILYGGAIAEVQLAENTKKLGSYSAVLGAFLVSISLAPISPDAIRDPTRILGFHSDTRGDPDRCGRGAV